MKLQIERGKEKINSNGGLAIVGAIVKRYKIGLRANSVKLKAGDPEAVQAGLRQRRRGEHRPSQKQSGRHHQTESAV